MACCNNAVLSGPWQGRSLLEKFPEVFSGPSWLRRVFKRRQAVLMVVPNSANEFFQELAQEGHLQRENCWATLDERMDELHQWIPRLVEATLLSNGLHRHTPHHRQAASGARLL